MPEIDSIRASYTTFMFSLVLMNLRGRPNFRHLNNNMTLFHLNKKNLILKHTKKFILSNKI